MLSQKLRKTLKIKDFEFFEKVNKKYNKKNKNYK